MVELANVTAEEVAVIAAPPEASARQYLAPT